MPGRLKTAVTIVILSGAALLCHSAEEFGIKHNLADDKAAHFISVKAGGIEILKNAGDSGILFPSTPAGKLALGAGFPGMTKLGRMDSLLILDDGKDIKTFEHSFSCEDGIYQNIGLKLKWVNVFKCHRAIPGVMIESRVINLTRGTASCYDATCYQYWTTPSTNDVYFTGTGKKKVPEGGVMRLQSTDGWGWVFFQINAGGGIGVIADGASKDGMLFSNFGNGKGGWGIRTTNQEKPVFKNGQGSVLRFVLFFAESPEKAKELYDKIEKENIFPELREKDAH